MFRGKRFKLKLGSLGELRRGSANTEHPEWGEAMENVLQAIETKIQTMPAISHVTTQLLPKLSDENFSVTEVARLIETDITLSTRCLHLVNTSYFGLR